MAIRGTERCKPEQRDKAVWLYLRFSLSYRDVEDLLAERGLEVSNESIRRWVLKFGSAIARISAAFDRGPTISSISTRWRFRLAGSECICGEPSTAKAKFSMY